MRSLFSVLLLACALAGGCSKKQTKETTPPPAAPAASVPPSAPPSAPPSVPPSAPAGNGEPSQDADPNAARLATEDEVVPSGAPDPGPRPAAFTDADIVLADRLIATIDKMVTNVNKAGADCPKVAAAIRAMSGELSSVAEEGKKLDALVAGAPAAKKWFEATYAPKVMAIMNKLMGSPCLSDKAVQEAMASVKM